MGKRRIKGLIFDLDGVIVDTAKYHFKAWKRLAETLGGSLSEEQNEHLKGVSRMASLDKIMLWNSIQLTDEQKETLAARKNSWYQDLISELSADEALPGAIDFLNEVRQKDFKIALGSASKNAPKILNALGITHLFDAIIDGNSVSKSKPDPEVFLNGAEAMQLEPSECIVFEDALKGLEAAINGGFNTVGVGSAEVLTKADMIIDGLGDSTLEDIIQNFEK